MKGDFYMLASLEKMSLEQKLGQLFIADYNKDVITGDVITLIKQYHVGGIRLALDNFSNRKKIAKMNRNLQYFASREYPLFITGREVLDELSDAENLTAMPKEKMLHTIDNRLYSKQLAEVIGQEYREIGLNALEYPHVEIDNTGDLRDVVDPVAHHSIAVVEGFKKSDVLSFISGFPLAHEIDSFIGADRRKSNLYPFYEVVKKGADVLMIEDPSKQLIHEFIRENLQFDQVLAYEVSDVMPISDLLAEDIITAINNGVNLIVLPYSFEEQIVLLNQIIENAKEGAIDELVLNDSLARIFALKEKYQLAELGPTRRPLTAHQINSVKEKIVDKYASKVSLVD